MTQYMQNAFAVVVKGGITIITIITIIVMIVDDNDNNNTSNDDDDSGISAITQTSLDVVVKNGSEYSMHHVCVLLYIYICIRYIHTYIHTYIYIYIVLGLVNDNT